MGSLKTLHETHHYIICSGFQSVDEEDYGGVWELTKEGFMTSMASFLVIWIIVYTGMHFD